MSALIVLIVLPALNCQVFREKILSMADVGPSGAEAICMFVEVGILTPRYTYVRSRGCLNSESHSREP